MENCLKKDERLHLKKDIDPLFASGRSFVIYPFRAVYRLTETTGATPSASILISIPKKRFRRAVRRNLLRRRTREAYRLNKKILLPQLPVGSALHLALLYISSETAPYNIIEQKMQEILTRLGQEIQSAAGSTAAPTTRER